MSSIFFIADPLLGWSGAVIPAQVSGLLSFFSRALAGGMLARETLEDKGRKGSILGDGIRELVLVVGAMWEVLREARA
jgi:hypothetical protein